MSEKVKHYPKIATLGLNCVFWSKGGNLNRVGCLNPNPKLQGRMSCEGIIDDVCIWQLTGRPPRSLTREQMQEVSKSLPSLIQGNRLPPGDTKL